MTDPNTPARGADHDAADRAVADERGVDQAGAGERGADERGADRAGADERGADQAGADERGADQAGADERGADRSTSSEEPMSADESTDGDTFEANGSPRDEPTAVPSRESQPYEPAADGDEAVEQTGVARDESADHDPLADTGTPRSTGVTSAAPTAEAHDSETNSSDHETEVLPAFGGGDSDAARASSPDRASEDGTTSAPAGPHEPEQRTASDSSAEAAPERQARVAPPLSPPSAAPTSAAGSGSLHDDSALRAAEAARSGESSDPATRAFGPTDAAAAGGLAGAATTHSPTDTGEVGDTRIVGANGARSSTAWTPPPAPASPVEQPTAATVVTPTPYAPPSGAPMGAPMTSTTPISSLGTSPAESLGFTDGIAGGDDGFTPAELAQRRAFRDEMAFRQKQEFAGINFGSAFFGWLAAVGLAGLLYLIAAGIASASGVADLGVLTGTTPSVKSLGAVFTSRSLRITAVVVFLVILFLAYFVGGFVASRMARFSGLKQGLAVWLWGLVVSIIAAVVGVVIASQDSTFATLQSGTGAGMDMSSFTTVPALISEGLVIVLSLGGALLGGLAGLRYHRRIDRFGLEEV